MLANRLIHYFIRLKKANKKHKFKFRKITIKQVKLKSINQLIDLYTRIALYSPTASPLPGISPVKETQQEGRLKKKISGQEEQAALIAARKKIQYQKSWEKKEKQTTGSVKRRGESTGGRSLIKANRVAGIAGWRHRVIRLQIAL